MWIRSKAKNLHKAILFKLFLGGVGCFSTTQCRTEKICFFFFVLYIIRLSK
uniref:Uncharacterized protein n=1 Tax=Rhizophora mucronata TaxID=61149 RepID=A0A2P2NBE1_RHIMU